jgi:fructose-1,6-bisphosphatase I
MDHAAEAQRTDLMTITRHVLNEQGRHPESRGDFTILLSHIVLGCKFVASAVNKAGLAKLVGLAGETNVQASTAKHHHARAFTITGCRSVITDPFVAFHLQTRTPNYLSVAITTTALPSEPLAGWGHGGHLNI